MTTSIDWGKEGEKGFKIYDDNTYLVEIKKIERKTASTGTPQAFITAVIVDGDCQGGTISNFMALSDNALFRPAGFLNAAGINLLTLPQMIVGSETFWKAIDMALDRQMYWEVVKGKNPKNGKDKNDVQNFIHAQGVNDPEIVEWDEYSDVPDFVKGKAKKAGLI